MVGMASKNGEPQCELIFNAGRWTLDAGRWTLDAGRWTLDAGQYFKKRLPSHKQFYISLGYICNQRATVSGGLGKE